MADSDINRGGPNDAAVAERLLAYLQRTAQDAALAYAEAPARMAGGFDAAIYGFRLRDARPPWADPLVLRLFRASRPPLVARREAAVQNALAGLGYPAARVVAVETEPALLGGPFLIMQRLPGNLLGFGLEGLGAGRSIAGLIRLLLRLPRGMRRMVRLWSEAQLALHALPVEEFARMLEAAGQVPADFTLDAHLAAVRQAIDQARLAGLAPGLDWLRARRPASSPPSICHGDLHPFNILVAGDEITGVIDWSGIAIADPALDLGTALASAATVPIAVPLPLRAIFRAMMRTLSRNVLRAYRRSRDVDAAALDYFQVYCCLRQLVWVGLGAAAGNPRVGAYGSAEGVRNLIAHIRAVAGITVALPVFAADGTAIAPAKT